MVVVANGGEKLINSGEGYITNTHSLIRTHTHIQKIRSIKKAKRMENILRYIARLDASAIVCVHVYEYQQKRQPVSRVYIAKRWKI